MALPTAEDFGLGPLDEKDAREHFLGRTLAEAEEMLRESPYLYFEDLMWMGPEAFRYYFAAAVRALVTDAPAEDAYALASFAAALEHRLSFRPCDLRPVATQLAAACADIITAHAETFVSQAEFYGDLRSRYVALQDAFTKTAA